MRIEPIQQKSRLERYRRLVSVKLPKIFSNFVFVLPYGHLY
jgi:hypothetical protein